MPRFVANVPVFVGSVVLIAAFVAIGVIAPGSADQIFKSLQAWILDRFGWFYILSVALYLATVVVLAMSRYGNLKLGPDDSTPEFRYLSWIAMLFAAGMGIGLMFFAVAEPITHFAAPPEAAPRSIAARREAMLVTFFHWGVHAWAIYAVVGLSLAYFGYRYNLPLTIRSGLYPFLKERTDGPIGHAVDIFAIVGTMFGIATSLGLGVLQINAGLNYLVGVPVSVFWQIVLIACITAVATASVVTGLDRGVRRLSEFNLIVAVLLMLFVLFTGPTALLLNAFVQNVGLYLSNFIAKTFNIYAYEPRPWIESWTLFYWAWWISWSPFVGMFIARISRGRTIREFTIAVLLVPAGFTFLWMTVFGNTAIFVDTGVAGGALAAAVTEDISVALFRFFEYLPFAGITSALAVMLVGVFFITSSDSGSLVIDTIAAGGETETPPLQRLFWCVLEGVVASLLLLAGGLAALQTATIASALPFAAVILVLGWGLFRGMSADVARRQVVAQLATPTFDPSWQKRLARILHQPTRREVEQFLAGTALPALESVANELKAKGIGARAERESGRVAVCLTVPAEKVRSFVYGVEMDSHLLPSFAVRNAARAEGKRERYYEARTFFSDGSRGYDVMGLSKEQLIADVLGQYERYRAHAVSPQSELYVTAPDAAPAAET